MSPDSVAAVAVRMDGLHPSFSPEGLPVIFYLKLLLPVDKEITAIVLPCGEGRSDMIPLHWQSCLQKMRGESCFSGSCLRPYGAVVGTAVTMASRLQAGAQRGQGRSPG